ncbi:hypothetical protein GCM10027346_01550 [Hymenobacter seoulensis]
MEDFLEDAFADAIGGGIFRLVGTVLKYLFLFVVSPYLLLRGWLQVRPHSAGIGELWQQGKQAAHDMQYVLSVVVALPLVTFLVFAIWEGVKALLT